MFRQHILSKRILFRVHSLLFHRDTVVRAFSTPLLNLTFPSAAWITQRASRLWLEDDKLVHYQSFAQCDELSEPRQYHLPRHLRVTAQSRKTPSEVYYCTADAYWMGERCKQRAMFRRSDSEEGQRFWINYASDAGAPASTGLWAWNPCLRGSTYKSKSVDSWLSWLFTTSSLMEI